MADDELREKVMEHSFKLEGIERLQQQYLSDMKELRKEHTKEITTLKEEQQKMRETVTKLTNRIIIALIVLQVAGPEAGSQILKLFAGLGV